MSTKGVGRYEGRLFAEDGRLYMVVEANEDADVARVSCCIDGERQVIEMSIMDVAARISAGTDLVLDNINGNDSEKRILRKKDGWFFSAREGLKGPYRTGAEAKRELGKYIVASQSAAAAG